LGKDSGTKDGTDDNDNNRIPQAYEDDDNRNVDVVQQSGAYQFMKLLWRYSWLPP